MRIQARPRRPPHRAIGIAAATAAIAILAISIWTMPPGILGSRHGETAAGIPGSRLVVVDGDTVRRDGRELRLLDIDAPETHEPRCPMERQAGIAATEALRGLLAGQSVDIHYSGRSDRYGRALVRLSIPAGDVADLLVARGLALPYRDGGAAHRERAAHWCG